MKSYRKFIPCCLLFLLAGAVWAAQPGLGEVKPGEYPLTAVSNHIPWAYQNSKTYWNSLQKVELSIGKTSQFKDLPKLGMKEPYTGTISLGEGPRKYGVIIDIVGEEKRLYIDSDADGSFAGENWTPLLNEWQGVQAYWVYGPEPVRVRLSGSGTAGRVIELEVSGLLNKPGVLIKEQPYLRVGVRTWFLGKINEDGETTMVAVVDRNNNGRYNDPEDQFFIDKNSDGSFELKEAVLRKHGVVITAAKKRLNVNWSVYPETMTIGGKAND